MTDNSNEKMNNLWLLTKALYRGSFLGLLLTLLFLPFLFMIDQTYTWHNATVPLERTTYNAMMFGSVLLKILVIVFFYYLRWDYTGQSSNTSDKNEPINDTLRQEDRQ